MPLLSWISFALRRKGMYILSYVIGIHAVVDLQNFLNSLIYLCTLSIERKLAGRMYRSRAMLMLLLLFFFFFPLVFLR